MSADGAHGFIGPCLGQQDTTELVRQLQAHLVRLKQGNIPPFVNCEEWDPVFRTLAEFLSKQVRGRHWSQEDRDDGVQELWLLLMTELPELDYDPVRGQLLDWISTVARNRLVDLDRYRKTHSMQRLRSDAADQLTGREPDPPTAFELRSRIALVHEALAELRPHLSQRDYEAFRLRWVDGLSVREIASRLGLTEAQVYSSDHRVKRKLCPLLVRLLNSRPRPHT
jgi:RNA polymerase sigma factor (sigma-70 family)